jgi:hypothetical protein
MILNSFLLGTRYDTSRYLLGCVYLVVHSSATTQKHIAQHHISMPEASPPRPNFTRNPSIIPRCLLRTAHTNLVLVITPQITLTRASNADLASCVVVRRTHNCSPHNIIAASSN